MKLVKNSFTLFETLLSTLVLGVVVVGFSHSAYYDNLDEEYMRLNRVDNAFSTQNYDAHFSTIPTQIKMIKNGIQKEFVSVEKISFSDEKITLIQYVLP